MAEAYGVWGEKKLYGKAYMGIVRSAFLIDEKGKISLTPVGALADAPEGATAPEAGHSPTSSAPSTGGAGDAPVSVSFEESFDAELRTEFGDLGPASAAPERESGDRGGRGGDRGGDRGGRGAPAGGRRRHR